MQVTKVLTITAVVLLVTLVVQASQRQRVPPAPRAFALYENHPTSVQDAVDLADLVVRGHVTDIPDLPNPPEAPTVNVPPGEEDHVTFRVTRLTVEEFLRGKTPDGDTDIPILQSLVVDASVPISSQRAQDGVPVSEDDPPYAKEHRYVLFLMAGPTIKLDGRDRTGYFVISPEGRYEILAGDLLLPAVLPDREGFANGFRQRPLKELEDAIRAAK